MLRWLGVLAGSLALHGGLATARAEPPLRPFTLEVRGEPGSALACLETAALHPRIEHFSVLRPGSAPDVRLVLKVWSPDSAELSVLRGSAVLSRRHFRQLPVACEDRRDTVALSLAMALDNALEELDAARARQPTAAGETSVASGADTRSAADELASPAADPRASEPLPVAPTEPQPAEPVAQAPRPDEPLSLLDAGVPHSASHVVAPHDGPALRLHAGVRWLTRALPEAALAAAFGAQLVLGSRVGLEVSGFVSAPVTTGLAGAQARTRLTGGEIFGCLGAALGSASAEGCFGLQAAAFEASGSRYPIAYPSSTLLWAAAASRIALRWPSDTRVSLRLLVQAHLNLSRPGLRIEGSTERQEPSWFGGAAGADIVVALQ